MDKLGTAVEEIDSILNGEIGSPVTDLDQSIQLSNVDDGFRLNVVHSRALLFSKSIGTSH